MSECVCADEIGSCVFIIIFSYVLMNKWSRLIFIRVTYTKLNRKIHTPNTVALTRNSTSFIGSTSRCCIVASVYLLCFIIARCVLPIKYRWRKKKKQYENMQAHLRNEHLTFSVFAFNLQCFRFKHVKFTRFIFFRLLALFSVCLHSIYFRGASITYHFMVFCLFQLQP